VSTDSQACFQRVHENLRKRLLLSVVSQRCPYGSRTIFYECVWCCLRRGDSSDEAIDSKDVDSNDDENEANGNEVVDDSDDDRTICSFAKTKADGVFDSGCKFGPITRFD
jgi:hypothetical protein